MNEFRIDIICKTREGSPKAALSFYVKGDIGMVDKPKKCESLLLQSIMFLVLYNEPGRGTGTSESVF